MRPTRRQLLQGSLAALTLPTLSRADTGIVAGQRRFLFVYAFGGWDPTRVFCPEQLGAEDVATEGDASEASAGGLAYVSHPLRPSVDAFFERWGSQTTVLNGLNVSSIAHASATRMTLTASVTAKQADWATRIATAYADEHVIPYLLVGGPSFQGSSGVHVGRAGRANQLSDLATGLTLAEADLPADAPGSSAEALVDAYLIAAAERRSAAAAGPVAEATYAAQALALERASELKALSGSLDLQGGTSFTEQMALAARVLSSGLCRVAAINHPNTTTVIDWDTHSENDADQSMLFEDLFDGLGQLATLLDETEGHLGGSLLEETTVVVLSEMGRTPFLNSMGGKEHWPYTSAMLFGAGIAGGRTVGAFDDGLYGRGIDLATGLPDDDGPTLTTAMLGATLLAHAGLDPAEHGVDTDGLTGL